MMRKSTQNQKGFTLVEILIVIGIIGLISSVVTISMAQARVKGRDSKRKSDLVQIQKALEIYYNTNNEYPHTCGATPTCVSIPDWYGMAQFAPATYRNTSGATGYIPNLAPTFITNLPTDPSGITANWSGYLYKSDGVNYKLLAHITGPESFPPANDFFHDSCRPTTAWRVTNNPSVTSACFNW